MRRIAAALFVAVATTGLPSRLESADASLPPECVARGGLPNVMAKLEKGGDVRIAYLGGSITAQNGWRVLSREWFQKQYPAAKVSEINAAIGGTGSDLGVFRLRQDALDKKPDLLFVEFAVNDGGAAPEQIHRGMEGIVRQTWKANPLTDICFVYTLTLGMRDSYAKGETPRSVVSMEKIADHYAIPSVNFGPSVVKLDREGKLLFKAPKPKTDDEKKAVEGKILFSADGVHPYDDSGQPLYRDALVRSMPALKAAGKAGPHAIPAPFAADNWENAKLVPLSKARLSAGWTKLDPASNPRAKSFANRMPEMWLATKPGETIEFKFRGTRAAVYDLLGPDGGQVIVTVDGRPPAIRPRFDSYCTYHRLGSLLVASDLPDAVHTVKLEIHPDQPDKAKILSQRNEKIDDPKRFDATAWHAGALMLVGDPVE